MGDSREEGPDRRRPPSVVALIALTFVAGFAQFAVGALLMVGAATGAAQGSPDSDVLALGIVLAALGACQMGVGVALARGVDGARIVLTLVVVLALLGALYDAARPTDRPAGATTVPIAINAVILVLAWAPTVRRHFQS